MNKIKNTQRGSTLISVMVSAGLISAIVVGSYAGLNRVKEASEFNSTGSSLCRLAAQNVLSSIRSSGGATKVFKSPITRNSISLSNNAWHDGDSSYNPDGVENENGISTELNEIRWPNQRVVDWTGGLPAESNAPKAIYSYMNSLASVYFSNGNVCSDREGVQLSDLGVADWGPAANLENFQVESSLRIRPYNLLDGSYSCGIGSDQWPRPFAAVEPPVAVGFNIIDLGNYDPNIGFEVEASIRLVRPQARNLASLDDDPEDDVFECSLTEKFSYDVQDEPIPEPIVVRNGANIDVTIPANRYMLGSYLLCRSDFHIFNDDYRNSRPTTVLGSGEGWRPCDQVTSICGQSLGPANINDEHTSVSIRAPTRNRCAYEYEAIIVDASGNMSLIASLNGNGPITGPPRVSTPDNGNSGPSQAYSVDGINYSDPDIARRAAALSGMPLRPIPSPPPMPLDSMFTDMEGSMNDAASAAGNAASSLSSAQTSAASVTAANASFTSANSSASIGGAISTASASVAGAQAAAASAQASANAALASAQATFDKAVDLAVASGRPIDGLTTEIASVKQALDDAAAAQAAADEAARLAEEARRALEELERKEREAREREEAEDDDDEDEDDTTG